MPWLRLSNFASSGYVRDIDAHALPPEFVSELQNTHTVNGVIERYAGYAMLTATTEVPYWLLSGGFSTPWLLAAGANTVYSVSGTGDADISNASGHSTVLPNAWTGGVLHGIALLNNGIDVPQYWPGTGVLADVTGWDPNIDGYTCKALRVFKNFVFALNISATVGDFPTMLIWSTGADPGALPASWDYTDPTNDAGTTTLSETPGEIVDGLVAGESFFIYKEDAVYEAVFIDSLYIFRFTPRFFNFGIMARNCAVAFENAVYVLGQNDIVVHNASQLRSIADQRQRKYIFSQLTESARSKCFVALDQENSEIMFCVPWNSDYPNKAFTYNPRTDRWGERDLPSCGFIVAGKTVATDATWAASGNWDADNLPWGFAVSITNMFVAGVDSTVYKLNVGTSADGDSFTALAGRRSIDFGSKGQPNEQIKFISRIRPNIVANEGVEVSVQVGSQMALGDEVIWAPAQIFVVGTTRDLCCRANGRYLSWRVSSLGTELWNLESIDFDMKFGAMW